MLNKSLLLTSFLSFTLISAIPSPEPQDQINRQTCNPGQTCVSTNGDSSVVTNGAVIVDYTVGVKPNPIAGGSNGGGSGTFYPYNCDQYTCSASELGANQCYGNSSNTIDCQPFCQPAPYNLFVACAQCQITNGGNLTSPSMLNQILQMVNSQCAKANSALPLTSSLSTTVTAYGPYVTDGPTTYSTTWSGLAPYITAARAGSPSAVPSGLSSSGVAASVMAAAVSSSASSGSSTSTSTSTPFMGTGFFPSTTAAAAAVTSSVKSGAMPAQVVGAGAGFMAAVGGVLAMVL